MKAIFTKYLIFFLIQNMFSQVGLEGTYCNLFSQEFEKCITFKKNKFTYVKKGSYGQQAYGNGIYNFYNNTIFLDFKSTKSKNKSYHKIIEDKKVNKKLYSLTFNIKDGEGNLLNTLVTVNNIIKKESNLSGNVSFLIPKSNSKLKIYFSRMGNDEYSFFLQPDRDYKINVYLNQFSGIPIMNVKKKMKVKILNKNSFKEIRKEGFEIIWRKI